MEGGGGDPSGVERPVGLDRLGGAKMQPLPAGQAEVPIQRLPGESVPERIGRLVQAALAAGAVPIAHVTMNSEHWIVLLIGFVVSFIVALGVVEWFLMWVRKHGFTIFAIYRIILGIVLLFFGSKFMAG